MSLKNDQWINLLLVINEQNITQNLDENITNEQEIHQKEYEDNEMIQLQDNNENNIMMFNFAIQKS